MRLEKETINKSKLSHQLAAEGFLDQPMQGTLLHSEIGIPFHTNPDPEPSRVSPNSQGGRSIA